MRPLARDFYAPLGLPADIRARMGDRTEQEAWEQLDDGRWLLRAATHLQADRVTLAEILSEAAPSSVLTAYREGRAGSEEVRSEARALLSQMAGDVDGPTRRALYARRAALAALLMGPREAAGYSHAACSYGQAVDADAVRSRIPWADLEALAAENMPAPPEDPPEGVRRNDRDAL